MILVLLVYFGTIIVGLLVAGCLLKRMGTPIWPFTMGTASVRSRQPPQQRWVISAYALDVDGETVVAFRDEDGDPVFYRVPHVTAARAVRNWLNKGAADLRHLSLVLAAADEDHHNQQKLIQEARRRGYGFYERLFVVRDHRDDEHRALEKAYRQWTHAKSIAHVADCECPQCITAAPATTRSRRSVA